MFFLDGVARLPVRADGRGGDVRDDRLVHPVAHAGADHGEVPAASRTRTSEDDACRRHALAQSAGALPARLRARASRRFATATATCWRWRWRIARRSSPASWLRAGCRSLLVPFLGATSSRRSTPARSCCTCARRSGTRVEETARPVRRRSSRRSAQIIPPTELGTVVDNIGLPVSGINLAYSNTGTIGPQDGDILIALNEGHRPTADYVRQLREQLPREFPGVDLLVPAGRHRQPDPQLRRARAARRAGRAAPTCAANDAYANELLRKIAHDAGHRRCAHPAVARPTRVQRRRRPHPRADQLGITERDVTNSLVVNLAGSSQIAPTFWLNPKNGVSYPIVTQTPQYRLDSLAELENLPITASRRRHVAVLGGLATITRDQRRRGGHALQHPADRRHLRHHAGPRPRRRRRRHPASVHRASAKDAAQGLDRRRCAARCRP